MKNVVTRIAVEDIVTTMSLQRVIAAHAKQAVIAVIAMQCISCKVGPDNIFNTDERIALGIAAMLRDIFTPA